MYMKFEKAMELASVIINRIDDLDGRIERANNALVPEKGDEPITRETVLVMVAKRLRKNGACISISTHSGKMELIPSIGTTSRCNGNCRDNRNKEGSICQGCYAETLTGIRKKLRYAMCINYILLTGILFESFELPVINAIFARLEAFGDLDKKELGGVTQGRNYIRIIRLNFRTRWAWWTKNPKIMEEALDAEGGKPENLTCVLSSMFINVAYDYDSIVKRFYFIDIVFTVYDKEFIKANGIQINCGARNCFKCGRCYEGIFKGYVSEIKK